MDIFISIFQAVATMFGIGIIGFYIIHRRVVEADLFSMMIPLVVDVALPSLVFVNILSNLNAENIISLWVFPVAWMVETIFFFVLTIIFSKFADKKFKQEFSVSLFYQNGIFFPIIVISQIYGNNSSQLVNLFLFTIFYPTFFFNTYSLFFKKKNIRNDIRIVKEILNPVMIATIVAIFLKVSGVYKFLPDFIFSIFKKVSSMTIPLLMIIIGGNIYIDFKKRVKIEKIEVLKFIAIKNFIFPLITLLILKFINLPEDLSLILFLESAVPPITAVPIFVKKAGGDDSLCNQFLLASFICSLISLPIMFTIFKLI